jgi:hypothetical protein
MPTRWLSVVFAGWLLLGLQGGTIGRCWGDPFTPGDLVVVRVGDGSSLSGVTAPVFLDEFNPSSGALVQSVAMPITASGSNRAFTLGGTNTTEGCLTRSIDGRYLSLAGYDANTGATAGASTPTAFSGGTTDRVVARVDVNASIDTTTVLTNAYSGNSVRSAATVDGSQFWVSGTSRTSGAGANTGGVYLISFGATTGTQLTTTPNDTRNIAILNGQLYVSSTASGALGVNKVGTGVPTTSGQPITSFVSTGAGSSPYSFVVFDLNNDGIPDRVYVADERFTSSGGLQKWTSTDGTSWTLANTFNPGTNTGLRGLTGQVVNGNPVLYGTTSVNGPPGGAGNQLVSFTDDGSNTSFVTLATAANMTAFRGVAFVPAVPEPGALALASLGALALAVLVGRRRAHGGASW